MSAQEDHDDTFRLLRESIRRCVEREIVPRGEAWEEQGFVPRERSTFGGPEQIKRHPPDIVAGKQISAVAVTEPDAGSAVKAIRTSVKRDADGWVLNGTKCSSPTARSPISISSRRRRTRRRGRRAFRCSSSRRG